MSNNVVAKFTTGLEYNFVYDKDVNSGGAIIIYLLSTYYHTSSKVRFFRIPLKNNHAENPHILAAVMYENGMTFEDIREYFEL